MRNIKTGIYMIENKINHKKYVGQSVNIIARWQAHRCSAENPTAQDAYTAIHKAIRKYGKDNFIYSIIEECEPNLLDEREVYWIKYYNTYEGEGYNMTPGGENRKGSNNPKARITEAEVIEIRDMYDKHISFREAFKVYQNKYSKSGFGKIWRGETWKHIKMEVYTEENRQWHKTNAKSMVAHNAITVRNIETQKEFLSLSAAANWSCCDKTKLHKAIKENKPYGHIPHTNQLAHWKLI